MDKGWMPGPQASNRGVRLRHVYVRGREPCIVFIHGLGADGSAFQAAPRLLSGGHAILIPDLAGFGGSSDFPDDFSFTIKAQADAVLALCESKRIKNIVIVGHSMGGAIGVLMAERWGDRVTHFVNAVGNLVSEDATWSREIVSQTYEEFRVNGFDKYKKTASRTHRKGRPVSCYRQALDRTTAQAMYHSAKDLVALSDRGGLLGRFLGLQGKKLYLKDEDTPLSTELAQSLRKAAVPIVEITNSGHSLMEDSPQAFYNAIDVFLRES